MRRKVARSGTEHTGEGGFTLVEMLVVMLILALLASIAIPAFFSQTDKAADAEAKSAASVAQKSAEVLATTNDGFYDGPGGVTVTNLMATEATLSGAALTVPFVDADSYTVRVQSDTGNTFDIHRNPGGTVDMNCTTAGQSGCPGTANWGQ